MSSAIQSAAGWDCRALGPLSAGPPAPPTAAGARDLYGVWISPGGIRVTQIFAIVTSPADDTYPDLGYLVRNGSEEFALTWREVTGVNDVKVAVVWDPPWTRDRMSDVAKLALGML